jgi:hypothetical protein
MVDNTSKTTRKFLENTITLPHQLQKTRYFVECQLSYTVQHNEILNARLTFINHHTTD